MFILYMTRTDLYFCETCLLFYLLCQHNSHQKMYTYYAQNYASIIFQR